MPLNHQNRAPQITNLRSRRASAIVKSIPEKKPNKIEYLATLHYIKKPTSNEVKNVISIETVTEFANFVYEINVEIVTEKKDINIFVLGLQASSNSAPKVEPAHTDLEFVDLVGEYTLNIYKADGAVNSAQFRFNPFNRKIEQIRTFLPDKINNRLFCEFKLGSE